MNLPSLSDFISVIPLSYAAFFPPLNPLGSAFVYLGMTHALSFSVLEFRLFKSPVAWFWGVLVGK
ncbi:MAG: hypothetical protein NTV32_01735 [Gammaproteobacteria bacterium]|nr:hypothetical protein [Gammaproteobacteria bacterium]